MEERPVLRLADYESIAKRRLDPAAFAYYAGGAGDETTLRDNVEAFRRRRLRPRVLAGAAPVDLSTELLGSRVTLPVGLAPCALHALADPEGEVATARAAASAGALMCLSTMSSRSLEDVAAAAAGPKWFQLYVHRDRAVARDLIGRAAEARYRALVVTVDLPFPGHRERELRHPISPGPHALGNFAGVVADGGGTFLELLDGLINPALTWADLEWIAGASGLPLVVKGILSPDDAALAVAHGAAGVVVSNHGGRQLDRVPATIDVVEEVCAAVGDRAEVYLDSGVRRGTDVVTALALGARAVFIGRPYLFALAAGGEAGVAGALELMRAELANALGLVGVSRPGDLSRAHVV